MMKKHLYFKLFLSLFLFVFLFPLILVADAECIGDLNGDLQVNYNDLVIFAMAYRATPGSANWNPVYDLNVDGSVSYNDLVIFAMHYRDDCRGSSDWTVMVYMDGDNSLDDCAWDDLSELESVYSTDEVKIVTQLDAYYSCSGTFRYYITGVEAGSVYPLYPDDIVLNLLEQNMADPVTLTSFVNWATTNYPAEKYLLVLWNHGGGWREYNVLTKGIIVDDTSGDFMTMAELVQGLNGANEGIDIISFDACLMQMAEVAYEIYGLTNTPAYMVGSQASEWGDGWPYDDILAHLLANPGMTEGTLCERIVDDFINYCGIEGTLSALDFSAGTYDTYTALNSFATALMASSYQDKIATARSSAQSYSYSDGYRIKDLYDFAERINNSVPDCQSEAQAVMNQVIDLVLYESHTGSGVANSHGLSIYIPDNAGEYDNGYDALQFAIDTQWDEFLKQEQITPGGMAYTWYDWPQLPAIGFYNFDVLLTIEVDLGVQSAYYWAHQFGFKNGNGGYMGLQTNGYMQGEWVGKMAIFSIWEALEAEPGPGASCESFGGEGEGWSCRIPYEWVEGNTYCLRILEICCAEEPEEDEWWGAWIIDTSTEQETFIGKIKVPGSWQWLDDSSVVWVEYYGQVYGCNSIPYAKARFEQPTADDGSYLPQNLTSFIGTTCTNTQITLIENQGVIFETGN